MSKTYPSPSTPSPNTTRAIVVEQNDPYANLKISADGEYVSVKLEAYGTASVLLTHDTALELIGALHDVMEQQDANEELALADAKTVVCGTPWPPLKAYDPSR